MKDKKMNKDLVENNGCIETFWEQVSCNICKL